MSQKSIRSFFGPVQPKGKPEGTPKPSGSGDVLEKATKREREPTPSPANPTGTNDSTPDESLVSNAAKRIKSNAEPTPITNNNVSQNDSVGTEVPAVKKKKKQRAPSSGKKTSKEKSVNAKTSTPKPPKSKSKVSDSVTLSKPKNDEPVPQLSAADEDKDKDTSVTSVSPAEPKPKQAKPTIASFCGSSDKQPTNTKDSSKYNPAAPKYNPIKSATWNHGDKVPYIALARTLTEIENESARLKIIHILCNYLRSVIVLSPDDLLPSIYLCLNQIAPAYEGLQLGIAEKTLMKVIAQSTGRTVNQIKADAQAAGDLGIVAEQSRSNQRMIFQPARLTVRGVFDKLKEIAKLSGQASQTKKIELIQSMFVACKHNEARFLIRSLAGKLRIGLAEKTVLHALGIACTLIPPYQGYPPENMHISSTMLTDSFKSFCDEMVLVLKTTYCECPNYDIIIPVILNEGIQKLPERCKLTPGIPLKPMLASATKGVLEVLQRLEGLKFTCEWKYDGERAQIHIDQSGTISIFSRNQENNTTKYPDIIKRLTLSKPESVTSCILDCEAVAWDQEHQHILPFQVLSTRKRKDASENDIKVQVCVFVFDLLYLNGEALVKRPYAERRALLKEHFMEIPGQWLFAKSLDTTAMEDVQEFLEESVKGKCEGLMVKTLETDATYEIAKRSHKWLKLKKDYLEGVGDTLDVVVIGGYIGRGKRTGTYGGFLLACYDKDNEEYQSICKIGTGFSDESLQTHTEFFKPHIIPTPKSYYRYDSSHQPDHWFDAVQVWEIKCADLSLSPVHRAAIGIVDPEKGISLRFPRFIKIRDDKNVDDATSAQQVAEMYKNQDQIKNQEGPPKTAEEDFY